MVYLWCVCVLITQSCPTLETPWTVACQAPLSMEFSRQEYCSGLLFPSPGDLPNPGIKPGPPALQVDCLPSEPPGKPWYNHTMDYHSAIERNEVLIHVTTWISLENIMLSERSQAKKATYCMIPFIWNVQDRQIHKTESRLEFAWGMEEGRHWNSLLMSKGFLGGWWKYFWIR